MAAGNRNEHPQLGKGKIAPIYLDRDDTLTRFIEYVHPAEDAECEPGVSGEGK